MDEFKKYLFDHRDQLDKEAAPPHRVWEQIQRQSVTGKTYRQTSFIKWMAAAGILVLATAGIFWWTFTKSTKTEIAAKDSITTKTGTAQTILPEPAAKGKVVVDTIVSQQRIPAIAGHKRSVARKRVPVAKKTISPVLALENNYATIINYQLKKLERTPIYAESPAYFHVFKKQWLDLARDEKKIRHDMDNDGLNDQVVGQLIRLYQQKLQLLQQLQTEINTMNNRTKEYPALRKDPPAYFKM